MVYQIPPESLEIYWRFTEKHFGLFFSGHNVVFGNILLMVIFSDTTEKECVQERYPHSKANIRLVQHCAAI